MTVGQINPPSPRSDTVVAHAYRIPLVRELPLPVADPADDRTW
jgi:hypothetical protein